jgi:hypothetical protein
VKSIRTHTRRSAALIATATAALCILFVSSASAATTTHRSGASGSARVNVVHGIPGVTVNVCVDGSNAIPNFAPGDTVAGVALPAGSHTFKIVAQSDTTCSTAGILTATATLKAGRDYTAVASLDATGTPQLSLFTNNVKKTRKGTARLTVRHVANAPAVNVWANGTRVIGGTGFVWGKSATINARRGIYAAWVSLPGQFAPVIGPAVLQLKAGFAYQVYAWGDATDGYQLAVIAVHVGVRR